MIGTYYPSISQIPQPGRGHQEPQGWGKPTSINQPIDLHLLRIIIIIVNLSCSRSLFQATKNSLHLVVLLVLAADFAIAEVDDRVGYEVEGDDAAAGFTQSSVP